jgi:hypothetical protein
MEQGNTKSLESYSRLEVLELNIEIVLQMVSGKPEADPPKGGQPHPSNGGG